MSCFVFDSLELLSQVKVLDIIVESALLVVQDDSLVFESDALLAVLDKLGDCFCDPLSDPEVVWVEESLESTDQDDNSRDLGRFDFIATRLSRVPMR